MHCSCASKFWIKKLFWAEYLISRFEKACNTLHCGTPINLALLNWLLTAKC